MKTPPLLSEPLRLFFPIAALHAALWPFLWIVVDGYALPLAHDIPSAQWHAHEMIFGTFGMALAGFLGSAVPEWTDTRPLRGKRLVALALLWLPGRIVGLLGWDEANMAAGVLDVLFFVALLVIIMRPMVERRSTRQLAFAFWLTVFIASEGAIRIAWQQGEYELSSRLLEAAICIFVVFFSLAATRINVVVINLALDPTGATSPYRPHPGRRHTASAMVTAYMLASITLPGSLVAGWFALAAGAAFFDRLAEWFIGKAALKAEVLTLALANAFCGAGFLALGASRLGADLPPVAGLHLLAVGGLGLAIVAVLIIAGLRHTGRDLRTLPWQAHAAILLATLAVIIRTVPEFGLTPMLFGLHHAFGAIVWAAAFAVWLHGFLPFLLRPTLGGQCS